MRKSQDPFARQNRPGRKPLFTSRTLTSVLALGTALAAPVTNAVSGNFTTNGIVDGGNFIDGGQPRAFQGNIVGGSGTARLYNNFQGEAANSGVPTDRIFIGDTTTILNWVPTDNATSNGTPITFLNSNARGYFQADGNSNNNFTVLNRILPSDTSRPILLNGEIRTFQDFFGPSTTVGGNVWFYSPGGILIGNTANINVGGLLLTSLDPGTDRFTFAQGFNGGGNRSSLVGSAASGRVDIVAGAQIFAQQTGSYVAIVAPQISQGGAVTLDGNSSTAAYVAAESASLSVSQGLYDIVIDVGTDRNNGTPIIHGGTTFGSASTGSGDNRRIYLVTAPKNTVITQLITGESTGSLGFDIAGAADVQGNAIVLSSGRNVISGTIDSTGPTTTPPGTLSTISLDGKANGLTFTSAVRAAATGTISIIPQAGKTLTFESQLDLQSLNGDIYVGASGVGSTLRIKGALNADNSRGAQVFAGQSATGGLIQLNAFNGGNVQIDQATTLTSTGTGGQTDSNNFVGGTGKGGIVNVFSSAGGVMTLNSGVTVDARGYGGNAIDAETAGGVGQGSVNTSGANPTAGVYIGATGANSVLTVVGTTAVDVSGLGGSGAPNNFDARTGGAGYGGYVNATANSTGVSGGSTFGDLLLYADGRGGASDFAGNGLGGTVFVNAASGSITANAMTLTAKGETGTSNTGRDVFNDLAGGFAAQGGSIYIQRSGSGTSQFFGVLDADAGGFVDIPDADRFSTGGGNAMGGLVDIYASGGTINLPGGINARANAFGGSVDISSGPSAGNATGGEVRINGTVGAIINVGSLAGLSANSTGGSSPYAGTGGSAMGGMTRLGGSGGTFQVTEVFFNANATGGDGATAGGTATGGTARITTGTAGGSINLGLGGSLYADALGGTAYGESMQVFAPFAAPGGTAQGGTAEVYAGSGTITIGTQMVGASISLIANGFGGQGVQGGLGVGGQTLFTANNGGQLTVTENPQGLAGVQMTALGQGGESASENGEVGNGGNGVGGNATIAVDSSSSGAISRVNIGRVFMTVTGTGGSGGTANGSFAIDGGTGGGGFGGNITLNGSAGSGQLTVSGAANMLANGVGGFGGSGYYDGEGSSLAGLGGDGYGGTIQGGVFSGVGAPGFNGSATFASYIATATGIGGGGGFGAFDGEGYRTAGGNGGQGIGGFTNILQRGAPVTATSVSLSARGQGGAGGEGDGSGNGGNGFGGYASPAASARFGTTSVGTLSFGTAMTLDTSGQAGAGAVNGAAMAGYYTIDVLDGATMTGGGITAVNQGVFTGSRPTFDPFTNTSGSILVDPSSISVLSGSKLRVTSTVMIGGNPVSTAGTLSVQTTGDFGLNVNGGSELTVANSASFQAANIIQFYRQNGRDTNNNPFVPITNFATSGLFSANDFLIGANSINTSATLNNASSQPFQLFTPGAIRVGGLQSATNIVAASNTLLNVGNVVSTGGSVQLGGVTSFTPSAPAIAITANSISAPGTVSVTGTVATIGAINSQNVVTVSGSNQVVVGTVGTASSINLSSSGGSVLAQGALNSSGGVALNGVTGVTAAGITAASTVALGSSASVIAGNIGAGAVSVGATNVSLGTVTAQGTVSVSGANQLTIAGVTGATGITLVSSNGTINATNSLASSGNVVLNAGGAVTVGSIATATNASLQGASISIGSVTTRDSIGLTATTGGVTYGSLSAGIVNPVTQSQQGYVVGINSNGAVSGGAISARGNVGIVSKTAGIAAGDITSQQQSIVLLGKGALSTGLMNAGSTTQGIYVADASMFAANNNSLDPTVYFAQAPTPVSANGAIPGSLAVNGTVTAQRFVAATTGTTQTGAINLTGALSLNGGALTLGNVNAASASLTSGGAVATGTVTTTGDTNIQAASLSTAGNTINAANLTVATTGLAQIGGATVRGALNVSGGSASLGTVNAGSVTINDSGAVSTGTIAASGAVSLTSAANVAVNGIASATAISLVSTGGLVQSAGGLNSSGNITLNGSTGVDVGTLGQGNVFVGANITAGGQVGINSSAGAARMGNVSGTLLLTNTAGAIGTGAVNATNVNLTASSITVGAVDARDSIVLNANSGGVAYGSLSAGIVNPVTQSQTGYTISVKSNGAVSGGAISAHGTVGVVSRTSSVTTGDIASQQQSVLLFGRGALTTGALSAGSTTQGVYVADAAMFGANNDSFDPTVYFAKTPTPVAAMGGIPGSLTVNGAVTAQRFVAATTGTTQTGAINLTGALSLNGGALTLGNVNAASASLTSSGAVATGAITTTGDAVVQAAGLATGANAVSAANLTVSTTGLAQIGGATVTGAFNVSGGSATLGNVNAGSITINDSGAVSAGTITTSNAVNIRGGSAAINAITAPTLNVTTTNAAQIGLINLTGALTLSSSGANLGDISAASANITSIGTTTIGNIATVGDATLTSAMGVNGTTNSGPISTGTITAGGNASVYATSIATGNVTANVISMVLPNQVAGSITTGDLSAASISLNARPLFNTNNSFGGSIRTGAVRSTGGVNIAAAGSITTTTIQAVNTATLTADGAVTTGDVAAPLQLTSNFGNVQLGNLVGDGTISAGGTLTTGNLAGGSVQATALNGNATIGTVTAGSANLGAIGGNLVVQDVDASASRLSSSPGQEARVVLRGNSVQAGNVSANGRIYAAATTGGLTLGNLTTDSLAELFAATDVSVGTVVTGTQTNAFTNVVGLSVSSVAPQLQSGGTVFPAFSNLPALGGAITVRGPISGGQLLLAANGAVTAGQITSNNNVQLRGGLINVDAINATGTVTAASAGNISVAGISGASGISLTGGVVQSLAALSASGNITLSGAAGANVGTLNPAGAFSAADINGGEQVSIASSAGGTRVGNVAGGLVLINTSGAINTDAVTSVTSISLQGSDVTVGALTARDSIGLTATTGGVTYGSLSAGAVNPVPQSQQGYVVGIKSNGAVTGGAITARGNVGVISRTSTVTTGDITSQQQSIVLMGKGTLATGALSAGSTTQGIYVADAGMFGANNDSLDPAVYFSKAATPVNSVALPTGTVAGALLVNGTVTGNRFVAATNGLTRTGNVALTGALDVRSGGINLGTVAASAVTLNSVGSINTLAITSPGAVSLTSGLATATGAVSGNSIVSTSGGNILMGNLTAPTGVQVSSFQPTITVTQPPAGTVIVGDVTASAGDVSLYSARNSVTAGNINASGSVSLASDRAGVTAGTILGREISVFALGAINTGAITANAGEIDLEAGPSDQNDGLLFTAGADITTGALLATEEIAVTGGGNVRIASATITTPRVRDAQQFYEVGIGAGGSLTVGDITAPGTVGMVSLTGAISTGNITTQDSVAALAGGNASFGSVTTTGTGYLYVGNASQLNLVDTDNGINTSLLLATAPVRSGGTLTFAGPVSTGRFDVASTGAFTTGNLTASSARVNTGGLATFAAVTDSGAFNVTSTGLSGGAIAAGPVTIASSGNVALASVAGTGAFSATSAAFQVGQLSATSVGVTATGGASFGAVATPGAFAVNSGAFTGAGINAGAVQMTTSGTASFNGAVVAPTITVASGDIAIGTGGSLGSAATSALTLTNSGVGASTFGGTVQTTGYTLDAAEIGRLRATQIAFNSAGNVTFNAATINAPTALNGATGGFRVATPGSIRIAGNVDFTNMTATNTATFVAGQRFEVVTPTGQLRLLGADNAVNGVANISAANVAVGNATLLDQLAVNPRFVGRDTALAAGNTGDAVNNAGYVQAGRLAFTVGNTLLIANSGTATTPAGFTAGTGGVTVAAAQSQTNAPVDVVIFGRSLDSTGTPTSSSGTVSTVVIAPDSTARISTTSSVNGCALGGANCGTIAVVANTVQNQLTQIASTIQSAVTGVGGAATNGPAGGSTDNGGTTNNNAASDKGSDGEDDGGDDGTSAATTSAVRVNVLIDTSSIGGGGPSFDTPVTSSGNASLWGGDAGGDVGSTGAGGLGDTGGPLGDLGGGGTLGGSGFGGAAGGSFGGAAGGGAGASFGAGAGAGAGGNAGGTSGGAAAGGSASSGSTGSSGGAASTGGTASSGGTAGSTSSAASGGTGGSEGGASAQGGSSSGGANGQSGETAATSATSSSSGGSGSGEAGASDAGTMPGGAAAGGAGAAGGANSGGNNKDEKTDKSQGGTTGGIN